MVEMTSEQWESYFQICKNNGVIQWWESQTDETKRVLLSHILKTMGIESVVNMASKERVNG
jgi:hypothetical protein